MEKKTHVMQIRNIQRELNYLINKELKAFSLGKHDLIVLKVINANHGINQNSICSILNEDKITVSKAVKKLFNEGYIEKRKSAEDKRSTFIYMTEKGKKDREKLMGILEMADTIMLKDLDQEERQTLWRILDKVYKNLKEESSRLGSDD